MNMIKRMTGALLGMTIMLVPMMAAQAAETFNPFVLASKGPGNFDQKVTATKAALTDAGFEVLGEYTPYEDTFVDKAHVIVVTNDELKKVATMSDNGGFAAPWRVGVTKVGDEIQVSYVNPAYIANAYLLKSDLAELSESLKQALGEQATFGAGDGLSARKLRKYKYTFGMERFDDVYELAEYDSHKKAVQTLEKNLAAGVAGVTKVYRLDLPNQVTIFGVARKAPTEDDKDMDENHIMSVVDFSELKGTPYLPYEIMVDGGKVKALHMRFRMAVHYPDLKMMGSNSFMNIMPSPNAIYKALEAAAGGSN